MSESRVADQTHEAGDALASQASTDGLSDEAGKISPEQPGAALPRARPVFLSYHRPDWETVRAVADQLRKRHIETFIDRENLVCRLLLEKKKERAIGSASAVVVFIGAGDQSV